MTHCPSSYGFYGRYIGKLSIEEKMVEERRFDVIADSMDHLEITFDAKTVHFVGKRGAMSDYRATMTIQPSIKAVDALKCIWDILTGASIPDERLRITFPAFLFNYANFTHMQSKLRELENKFDQKVNELAAHMARGNFSDH